MSSQSTGDGHVTDHRHLQAGHRPGQGPGAGREPGRDRHAAACRRRCVATRRHRAQGLARHPAGRAHVFARRLARPAVHLQLRHPAHPRRAAAACPGVGDIGSRAARDYSMRIWIDPDKAAARNLTVDDIVNALRSPQRPGRRRRDRRSRRSARGGSAYQLNIQTAGPADHARAVRRHHHQDRRRRAA